VVVDVRLALVLALGILVRLMVVPYRGMVVLVVVSRREMRPVLTVREVVDDVMVRVRVDRRLVIVLLGHDPASFSRFHLCPTRPGDLEQPGVDGTPGGEKDRERATEEGGRAMGFKTGLLVGFGVGYVLGTRAGRERFEELKASWDQFVGNPSVQRMVSKGKEVVETAGQRGIRAVEGAADDVQGRLEGPESAAP
jgi:hypothetical protein